MSHRVATLSHIVKHAATICHIYKMPKICDNGTRPIGDIALRLLLYTPSDFSAKIQPSYSCLILMTDKKELEQLLL